MLFLLCSGLYKWFLVFSPFSAIDNESMGTTIFSIYCFGSSHISSIAIVPQGLKEQSVQWRLRSTPKLRTRVERVVVHQYLPANTTPSCLKNHMVGGVCTARGLFKPDGLLLGGGGAEQESQHKAPPLIWKGFVPAPQDDQMNFFSTLLKTVSSMMIQRTVAMILRIHPKRSRSPGRSLHPRNWRRMQTMYAPFVRPSIWHGNFLWFDFWIATQILSGADQGCGFYDFYHMFCICCLFLHVFPPWRTDELVTHILLRMTMMEMCLSFEAVNSCHISTEINDPSCIACWCQEHSVQSGKYVGILPNECNKPANDLLFSKWFLNWSDYQFNLNLSASNFSVM